MHSLSRATRKIEFEDNFRIKADYQSRIVPTGCLQSVPVTTGGSSLQIAVRTCLSVYTRRVRTFACIRIDCTLPVN